MDSLVRLRGTDRVLLALQAGQGGGSSNQ